MSTFVSVEVNGKEFSVKKSTAGNYFLGLHHQDIKKISQIKGLDKFSDLKVHLSLDSNRLTDIKGLECLVNLESLDLGNNRISEIKGLDNFVNLQYLYFNWNKISEIKGLDELVNLRLLSLQHNNITEIKGLENLTNLEALFLNGNQISEIKGLDTLTNLELLSLQDNSITELKGLEKLTKLTKLYLRKNPIPDKIIRNLGGHDKSGQLKHPEEFVEYCQQRTAEALAARRDKEAVEKLKKLIQVSKRVNIDMMRNKLNLEKKEFDNKVLEWAIEFDFEIDGDYINIDKEGINDFIKSLERHFEEWSKNEKKRSKKA